MSAWVSILGLYNFDNNIFDNLQIPTIMDKENVIENILFELAEFEIIFSDPDMMKYAIGSWSKKEKPVWDKLVETTLFEYNPIHNFDRNEEFTDVVTRDLTKDTERESTTTGTTQNSGTDIKKSKAPGYNEETLVQTGQEETEFGSGNSVSGAIVGADAEIEAGTIETAHSARMYGNIGVMSTQQMIQLERNVALFNVTDVIIASFKNRFCIQVY